MCSRRDAICRSVWRPECGEPAARKRGGFFLLHNCNSVFYLFLFGVFILILSAFKSASIWLNTAANFGFAVCMRLLLWSAMLIASLSISSSGAVNILVSPCAVLHLFFIFELLGSVKPERQNGVACFPVSPARLDQPR